MRALSQTRAHVEAAWRSFVVDGQLPATVRPEIARSWQRVRSHGRVDPALRACPQQLTAAPSARGDEHDPSRLASPILTQFGQRLAADGHVVAYFDARGVMHALEGNGRTIRQLADVNFAPGACWAEESAGTNGIGTALIEQRPVEVFASEHFVEAWQRWTCASVPVRWHEHVIGVVDITSPWDAHHPGLLITAEAVAHAIEARLDAAEARHEIAALLDAAADASLAREAFLAVASHELKTPLTPLHLELQKLLRLCSREATPLDPARLARALHGADGQVRRLVEIIDDAIDAARGASEPIQLAPERADLGAIVREVVDRLAPDLVRHRCQVSMSAACDATGRWDRARLAQASKHLLLNAMRYAPGRIEVAVESNPVTARLLVSDHGPGIAPALRERIFAPFERGVSYRNVAGFGLGLHVVRRIVEAHGGVVSVESAPGHGSTFGIELPRTGGAAAP